MPEYIRDRHQPRERRHDSGDGGGDDIDASVARGAAAFWRGVDTNGVGQTTAT